MTEYSREKKSMQSFLEQMSNRALNVTQITIDEVFKTLFTLNGDKMRSLVWEKLIKQGSKVNH